MELFVNTFIVTWLKGRWIVGGLPSRGAGAPCGDAICCTKYGGSRMRSLVCVDDACCEKHPTVSCDWKVGAIVVLIKANAIILTTIFLI